MRTWTMTCVAALPIAAIGYQVAAAQTLQPESIARQQQVQQRVRAMARQLVTSVLDLQLQQLRKSLILHYPVPLQAPRL